MKKKMIAVFSHGIARKEEVKIMLGIDKMLLKPASSNNIEYVVGWGCKPNTKRARCYAEKNKLDYYSLEDGFLHSMGQGVLGFKSSSLVKDRAGIYYDATRFSDLELIISELNEKLFNDNEKKRAKEAIHRITQGNITKYNNALAKLDDSIFYRRRVVLIIDQTAGDMSLQFGYVKAETFDLMLRSAVKELSSGAQVIIKTHPDVIVGKKKSSFDLDNLDSRIMIVSEPVNSLALLKKVDVVYVATSQMGFEALMLGKKVICFGVPFYAGWGLTEDRADKSLPVWSRRNKKRTLEELFIAAYIHYSYYLLPESKSLCELEDVLSYFEVQLKSRQNYTDSLYCINFTRWKKNHIKSFLGGHENIIFVSSADQAIIKGFNSSSQLVTWASKSQSEVNKLVQQFNVTSWQVEDGFIRSVGLGSDLTTPASLVLDKTGIYYDPSKPSDLETLLQTKLFNEQALKQARQLRKSLLENELSKYNLGKTFSRENIQIKSKQKIILVPGQVEGDASIKKGCIDIKTNADLIKAVRLEKPDAFLIYKPHPDVVSGNRKGSVDKQTLELCDLVLMDASITDCLAVVDEVHTMTSLVGFEGLLRKLNVVCYGQPFYSSWGLTDDRHPVARRTRKLMLDELVAGTLIDYPLYINWQTGDFTTPEVIVHQLKEQIDKQGGKQSYQIYRLHRQIRKLKNIFNGIVVNRR